MANTHIQRQPGSSQQPPDGACASCGRLFSAVKTGQREPVQSAAPQLHDRSSSPSYDSTRKTLGANAGRSVLEPSSCDTNTPTTPTALRSGCVCPALLPLVLFLSVDKTRPEREKWPHMRLDGTQTPNHSTQLGNGTARHVTSRHDSTRHGPFPIILPIGLSIRFFFSAVCLFRRLLPTPGTSQCQPEPTITACSPQKSLLSPLFLLLLSSGSSVFYFRPARPLNRALPPDLQLRSNPTRVGTGAMQRSGRLVPVSWGWCAR